MRNMPAILGIQRRPPRPTAGPMPMVGGPVQSPGGLRPSPRGQPMIRRAAEGDTADPGEGKISPEEVDYSANDNCGTCANMGDSGDCTKYNFPVEESGHCEAGYEAKGDGSGGGMDTGGVSSEDSGAGASDSATLP